MKYIKKYESNTTDDILRNILDHFNLKLGYDYIFKDGQFHFSEDVDLSGYKMPNGIFPVKIISAHELVMKKCGLISFENFPDSPYGLIDVRYNFIKNMKYFPQGVALNTEYNISHNQIEDLIGIPIEIMYANKVNYGNLDRDILDRYWDYQIEEGTEDIIDLMKNLKVSRNTINNNTVSPKSQIGQYIQGKERAKKSNLWDLK